MGSCIDRDSSKAGWHMDHSYARLPELFFTRTLPMPVREPRVVIFNQPLAKLLGLDLSLEENAKIFVGNEIPEGALPIAQAYAGHQFGHFTSLGDGRAILLGEQICPDGSRFDVQLKGPGRTPYSRGGDGRAALGPMLREYIISEAMHALGIPTTRSLAVATTGEEVVRAEILTGAVLTRIAASHIRVGTFQHAAAHEDLAALRALADHTRKRHYPDIADGDSSHFEFFQSVIDRQAELIAKWMHVGFIHGVMNTDNMTLSGETIDYGPCAFMDDYDPDTVFSSIDRQGRYAYGNQAAIARWNLARLAEAMLPLFAEDQGKAVDLANEALAGFEEKFQHYWLSGMRAKIGIFNEEDEDISLVNNLLEWMHKNHLDFTNTFRNLSDEGSIAEPSYVDSTFISWHERWSSRLTRQPQSTLESVIMMRANNPAVIPRNHKVEEALAAATELGDLSVMERLLAALAHPYDAVSSTEYTLPPPAGNSAYQTYCGT
jgi:uncharacterized protein YdiU (UPF0061 family)